MKCSKWLTLVVWSLAWVGAWAQPGTYNFMHFDVNNGLTHNEVLSFYQDQKGFLWIGTASGLNRFDGYTFKTFQQNQRDTTSLGGNSIQRIFEVPDGGIGIITAETFNLYDPARETFQRNTTPFYNTYNIPPGQLWDVVKDPAGDFWFIHQQQGVGYYNAATHKTIWLRRNGGAVRIASDTVRAVARDVKGNVWLTHTNGKLEKLTAANGTWKVAATLTLPVRSNERFNFRMAIDHDGDLWIFAENDPQGVYYVNTGTNTVSNFTTATPAPRLSTNLVRDIAVAHNGLVWVGTDHGGINIIDKNNLAVQHVVHRDEDARSLGQNSVNKLYKDREGIMWVGTYKKGVSYFHENIIRFPLYQHTPETAGLPYGDVNRFVEDEHGNLWIGTNGGGLIYFNRANGTFKRYRNIPGDNTSLSSDVIVSLCIDHDKKLWVGTYYGGLNCFDGKKFSRYNYNPSDTSSLSSTSVWEIFEDSQHRLWIGTLNGGLDMFDRRTGTFRHHRNGAANSILSPYVAALMEDKEGNLWVGTSLGVDVLQRDNGRFVHYGSDPGNLSSLSNPNVLYIAEDSKGRIWVGTFGGLNLFDKKTKTFTAITKDDGLPHNTVLTVLEDNRGDLWVSTPNGLAQIKILQRNNQPEFAIRHYDEAEGLQGKQFNENAAFKTSKGELVFGGANGFNIFRPEMLGLNKNVPPVVFTDFQLFNKSLKAEEEANGKVLLTRAITEVPSIMLHPGQNVFSIEFAALNFFHPENNTYQYRLEGFDDDWLTADAQSRRVTFTNLDPGTYTLRVKAANNDGVWNEKGASLVITVLPPFWKTRPALALYFLLIIGALFITRRIIQQREQTKFAIQQERQEAMRMHELDMMKIKFFTNVSHEFRTPLTLILTPLERMIRQAKDEDQHSQFQLIQRNARRLLNLVNQLLDFRKLEVQEIRFNPSEGDIIAFIKETVYSFSDLSEKKDIRLTFETALPAVETIFDQDKLEKILFNLLSNAFKFTPEHGQVSVEVTAAANGDSKQLVVRVKDTGIGIAADKLDRIFERFFQSELPRSMVNQGSGIGLSITREFVKIHGGSIIVESEIGKGSTFTVTLPLQEVAHPLAIAEAQVQPEAIDHPILTPNDDTAIASGEAVRKPVLLLVEDNEDFRFYLKDNLKQEYQLLEARNGKEGWKRVQEELPDLVVSDVMMPQMNGIELCRRIKSDQRVSHIPVILLTARAAEEQKLEGFQTGADDYITKPFNFEILASRIQNLIHQREKFHKAFPHQLDVKASELHITPLDEKFIQSAVKTVEDNVSNADFSVEDLGRELGISRAHLYKKIVALTGKSPLEFIRTIRLQQAAQLLEKSQLTVAEVAYQVGFNNPKYFARYFKEAYHVLPSAYAAGKRKDQA